MKVFSCWSQRNTARAWSSINYGNNGEIAPLPVPGPAPPGPTFTMFNSHKDGSDQGSDDTSTHGVESAQGAMSSSFPEEKMTPNRWFKCFFGKELKTHRCEAVCVDLVESITIGVFVMCVFFFPTACLPWKKIGLEVWGRWDFTMEISHHPGLCQASLDKYNNPHPPVWTAIYGELLIKRKEDSQWVRRADHRPPLIGLPSSNIDVTCSSCVSCNLKTKKRQKGPNIDQKTKIQVPYTNGDFFRENLQCNNLGNTVHRKHITTYPRRIQGR